MTRKVKTVVRAWPKVDLLSILAAGIIMTAMILTAFLMSGA